MLGRKLTPKEGLALGFVNEIFPDGEVYSKTLEIAKEIAQLPPQALAESKQVRPLHSLNFFKLLKPPAYKAQLDEINLKEVEKLCHRWTTPEFMEAVTTFMMKKNSTKAKL
jgi:enoyl-CoA hydratase/carnithine racemase